MQRSPDAVLEELEGLRALARSLVHGDADADDLIQDTAVVAITHPPASDRPARPWLATVLRNRWRMNHRSDTRRKQREHAAAPAESQAADDPIDRARILEKLSAALVALDEPFRTTVIRRYIDGESAADIARSLGVPPGTVRWRLKTGLDRLRAALDETTPTWKRALIPFVTGSGATVKAKTSILVILALVLAVGSVVIVLARRQSDERTPVPTAGGSARTGSGVAAVTSRSATTPKPDAPAFADPRPGQGRATLETRDALGGVVAGRVINWSTGDGVANAELTFGGESGATTVRSDVRGSFALAPTSPGRFVLTAVVAPGFLPYAPELQHSSVHIELAPNRAVEGITVFLFPAVDYHGKVVDTNGAPVQGAKVRLLGTPMGEQVIEKLATEWVTDARGEFMFHAADEAVFEAARGSQRGFARLDGDVMITKLLVIRLGTDPARDATISGKTVDASGAGLADVLVRAIPEDAPGAGRESTRSTAFATSSGPDGVFVLDGLDRGKYYLVAETEDRAPTVLEHVIGGSKDVALVLDAGKPIAGHVVTTAGEPVPAFTLLVLRRDGVVRELVTARSIVEANGRFEVRVTPGAYELLASASGWAPSSPTTVTAGERDAKVVVSTGAVLRGVVVDAITKGPVQYARIMREAAGGGASAQPANAGTVTRADGTFELTGIPPGPVSITVGAGGYHPRIESGMTASDGVSLGPLTIALTQLGEGEKPTLELVGIGVKLAGDGDALRVDFVMPESGAQSAGIVAGDRFVAVDGVPIAKLGLEGAISRIRGTVGTTIAITLRRGEQIVQLVVERRKVKA